jgi:hypothetical protein
MSFHEILDPVVFCGPLAVSARSLHQHPRLLRAVAFFQPLRTILQSWIYFFTVSLSLHELSLLLLRPPQDPDPKASKRDKSLHTRSIPGYRKEDKARA